MRVLGIIIKDCLTVSNGNDWCFAKTSAFLSLCVYFPMASYMLYRNPDHFSLSEFAIGIGTIVGSAAAAARIKKDVEPE